ncbi:uncharacterized protein LOC110728453 [Chenopodium quinoa]|uniref:uncharacterized protein LOC110728453 n=1 Tax=Chenopodium quinoa TaxID=63459 RepID=UPI000B773B4C|nr:uncharacterized protein LOC110728453 [Chenopodium quinoa]
MSAVITPRPRHAIDDWGDDSVLEGSSLLGKGLVDDDVADDSSIYAREDHSECLWEDDDNNNKSEAKASEAKAKEKEYMARKKKKVQPNDDSEESSCEERGRAVVKKVGKTIHAGTQIPLQWHPSKRVPTGEHKTHFSTYIGVMARERISIAYKDWHEVPTGVLDEVYGFISELSEKNREKAKKKSSSYRGGRLGYQYFEEEIVKELEKQGVHVSRVSRHLTWIKAHSHVKDGVITFDNLADKEIHDAIGRDDILAKAMHKSEHGGSVRGVGSGITVKDYFGYNKPAPPSQLHAEIGMMKSKLVSMDNRQNFMMSFLMSCCSQEQIKSFMAVGGQQVGLGGFFGCDNTSSSLDAGFGGLTSGSGGLRGFGNLIGGFSGLTGSLAGGSVSLGGGSSGLGVSLTGGFGGLEGGSGGLAGGSGGLEGGQANGSLGLAGGSGGLEGGSSGLTGSLAGGSVSLGGGSSGLGVSLTGGFGDLAGGSGGLEGGQANGSLGLAGGSGGLEGESSGLAGGSRAPQLDDTFGQGLQGIPLTQLLTGKIFEQGRKGHGFTPDSLGG